MLKEKAPLPEVGIKPAFRDALNSCINSGLDRLQQVENGIGRALDGVDDSMEAAGVGIQMLRADAQKGIEVFRRKAKPIKLHAQESLDSHPRVKHAAEQAREKTKETAKDAFDKICNFLYKCFNFCSNSNIVNPVSLRGSNPFNC